MRVNVNLAASLYMSAHGYAEPDPDTIRGIVADPTRGRRIAQEYVAAGGRVTAAADAAYWTFAREVGQQYRFLLRAGYRHTVSAIDPYKSYRAMFDDVACGTLTTYSTAETGGHPYLTDEQNDQFRFVHDIFGHYHAQRGFDRDGEEAAWYCHAHMFSPLAKRAMTTETRGQNSVFNWFNNGKEFPEEKIIILSEEYNDVRNITVNESEISE